MASDPVEQLIVRAGAPLRDAPPIEGAQADGRVVRELMAMLRLSNGFYAFESALHVLPSGGSAHMSLERWNERDLWRQEYGALADGLVFFAEDIFGGQFVLTDSGVGTFDPETADVALIGPDLDSWASAVLHEYEILTGHPVAHEWQLRQGPIRQGERLLPKVPFVAGGSYEIENLWACDAVEGMKARGDLAQQIHDLPDGSTIRYRVVE